MVFSQGCPQCGYSAIEPVLGKTYYICVAFNNYYSTPFIQFFQEFYAVEILFLVEHRAGW